MKTHLECIPCFIRQTVEVTKDLGLDEEQAVTLTRRVLEMALELDWQQPPPLMGRDIHRVIREITGERDPYHAIKINATEAALELLPELERRVTSSEWPFHEAVRASIAGNTIDLGAKMGREVEVSDVFEAAFSMPVDKEAAGRLEREVQGCGNVLFITDNAGEIVFDRPLLELIGSDKVTVAVRGNPTINDATRDDADRSGITERFRVITSGTDVPGTWLKGSSGDLVDAFTRAETVIAKGQGNYETLSEQPRGIWFLLRAKCPVVAEDLGVPEGAFVVKETIRASASDKERRTANRKS
ncbi:MAG: DUF89 family protein [Planctomycetes bacterium]|nr:DUF89 family protein [Planctomycetota bacterium]